MNTYLNSFDEYLNRNSDEYEIPKEEFEQLKEQYKLFHRNYTELKDEIECRNSTWETKEGEYEGEIAELKEDIVAYATLNDKLKENINHIKYQLYEGEISELIEENDKLKENINHIKYQLYEGEISLELKDEINQLKEQSKYL